MKSVSADGSRKEVARMAWPLAVGMLSFTLMGVVDTLVMGRVSTAAQAGVGLGATLVFVGVAFFRGLTSGAQSLVAAADGAGDRERASRAAGAALLVGLTAGGVATALLGLLHGPVLALAAPDSEVVAACEAYVSVRLWGLPMALVSFAAGAVVLGFGDTRTRMWVSLVANVANAVLDVALVFGVGPVPALGVEGAAVATVCSTTLMAGLYLVEVRRRVGWPRLPDREVVRSALALGLPSGAQALLNVMAFAVMNLALARAGAAQLAASQVVLQVASVSFLPGFGVGEAGGVLVGRYLGAGRPASAARALRSARTLALALMGACGLVFALWGSSLAGLFSRDPEVVRLAAVLLLFAASFQLFDAVATVHLCALRGAGDTRFTLAVTTFTAWGVLVPVTLGLGLGLGWGAEGAWLGLTLEVAALAAVTGWRVAGLGTGRVGRLDLLLGSQR